MKERKKRSIIWTISKDKLIEITKQSNTITQILNYCNLSIKGGNSKTLQKRLAHENINFNHISLGRGSNRGKTFPKESIPLKDILVENSNYNRGHLKKRLLKENILKNECSICKLGCDWNGQKIVHILDHINGISNDNRSENLRLVCPNCNSQLDTFAGRNIKRIKKKEINPNWRSLPKLLRRKVIRPSKEELEKMIQEIPMTKIGLKYGVSDNAVRKWIKSYNTV